MVSRIRQLIIAAEQHSAAIVESLPGGSTARASADGVNTICRSLVARKTPMRPTAGVVAEEGRKLNPTFPSERTIYNSYHQILRIWRLAYRDVMNIEYGPPLAAADVANIDTSLMEASVGNIVDRLKIIIFELTQRNNVLKQIIDSKSQNSISPSSSDVAEIMQRFGTWLRELADNKAFELDELALKVTRRTPVGTRIIDARLLETLLAFADKFNHEAGRPS